MNYATLTEAWGDQSPLPMAYGKKGKKSKKASATAAAAAATCEPLQKIPTPPPLPEFDQKEPACGLLKQQGDEEDIMDAYLYETSLPSALSAAPYTAGYANERGANSYGASSPASASATTVDMCSAMPDSRIPRGVSENDDGFFEYAKYYSDEAKQLESRHTADAVRTKCAPPPVHDIQEEFDQDDMYVDRERYVEYDKPLERYQNSKYDIIMPAAAAASEVDTRRTNTQCATDFTLYVVSGVLLIFMMEQFLRLGMNMRVTTT